MVLQAQLYPEVGYAPTGEYNCQKSNYYHQEYEQYYEQDHCKRHGEEQQPDYRFRVQDRFKPPQPLPKHHHGVSHGRQHTSASHGYGRHSDQGNHHGDGLYGKPHIYESQGYTEYSNGSNRYDQSVSYSFHGEKRCRCPSNCECEHKNQQNWAFNPAEWIVKSLED